MVGKNRKSLLAARVGSYLKKPAMLNTVHFTASPNQAL